MKVFIIIVIVIIGMNLITDVLQSSKSIQSTYIILGVGCLLVYGKMLITHNKTTSLVMWILSCGIMYYIPSMGPLKYHQKD